MAIYCTPPQSDATQKDITDELNQICEDSLLGTKYVRLMLIEGIREKKN